MFGFAQKTKVVICVFLGLAFLISTPSPAMAGDVIFETVLPWYHIWFQTMWGNGQLTYTEKVAIKYRPAVDQEICTIKPGIYKYSGAPTDNVIMTVREGGTYPLNGTAVATVTVPASQIATASIVPSVSAYTTFTLPSCLIFHASTNYFFVFSRTQPNSLNTYALQISNNIYYPQTSVWAYVPVNGNWQESTNYEPALRLEGPEPPPKVPVLIIPGIAGSELYNGEDLIWADLGEMVLDLGDEFLREGLILDENGNSIKEISVGNVIEKIPDIPIGAFSIDTFKTLRKDLESDGYSLNNNLFYFPYDWRLNLTNTAQLLKGKIDQIKLQTGQSKVDIVAHSMGGLLTKEYVKQFGKDNIDKLIFVGTPHIGAPKAAKTLLKGDNMGIPWLEGDRIKEVADHSIAVHELLPGPKYFDITGQYIKEISSGNLLNYDQTKNLILNNGSTANVFNSADNFFAENLEDTDFSGIDTYNIAGCKNATQGGYEIRPDDSIAFLKFRAGDQTVPLVSSDYISIPNNHKFYSTDGKHAELPSRPGVRSLIADILSGKASSSYDGINSDSSVCGIGGKELIWRSPVEVHIYDLQNRHTGPIEGGIEYGIPGVDYEIFGHEKFIFIPNDGDYRVEAHGLDTGTFDLSVRQNNNGTVIGAEIFNDIPITPLSKIQFNVSGSRDVNSINLDEKGDGNFSVIQETSHVDGDNADDLIPPVTNIISPASPSYKRSFILPIDIQTADDNSGVFSVVTKLDGDAISSTSIDLFYYSLSSHSLYIETTDNAGNTSTKSFDFQIIATPNSTIADIERAYAIGWIKAKNAKNNLVEKIKSAIRIEKRIEYFEEQLLGKPKMIGKIEKLQERLDKLLATQFLDKLNKEYNKGSINLNGYNLLKEDIEWLLQ